MHLPPTKVDPTKIDQQKKDTNASLFFFGQTNASLLNYHIILDQKKFTI